MQWVSIVTGKDTAVTCIIQVRGCTVHFIVGTRSCFCAQIRFHARMVVTLSNVGVQQSPVFAMEQLPAGSCQRLLYAFSHSLLKPVKSGFPSLVTRPISTQHAS